MNSPDKTVDNRPEHLIAKATIEELLAQSLAIDSIGDTEEKKSRVVTLNNIAQFAIADSISLDAEAHIFSMPTMLQTDNNPSHIKGLFMGFKLIEFSQVIYSNDNVETKGLYGRNPITLCVNSGTAHFDNSFTTGTFQINRYIPVKGISNLSSLNQIQRIFSSDEFVEEDVIHDKLLKVLDTVRTRIGNKPFYDNYRKLSLIEPWDFRGNKLSINQIRNHRIDVNAQRASVFFTDIYDNFPVGINLTDLSFSGYFLATSKLNGTNRHPKPCFVFELYNTDSEEIAELALADPTEKKPLVYVPISDKINLDIKPSN